MMKILCLPEMWADETPAVGDAQMEIQFRKHLSLVKPWLARRPNMEVLYISYNALISNPEPCCQWVLEFIRLPLDLDRMLSLPSGELYRNRVAGR